MSALLIVPQSELTLYNYIPYDVDYQNVRMFKTISEQTNYFNNYQFKKHISDNIVYIRENGTIKIESNYELTKGFNYCRYKNESFQGYIYAFIVDVKYINENVIEMKLQTDVWQTYGFNVRYQKTLIERANITEYLGSSLVPNSFTQSLENEGLEFGEEYDITHTEHISLADSYYLLSSTISLLADGGSETSPKLKGAKGGMFDFCPSMATYYIVDADGSDTSTIRDITIKLQDYPWIAQGVQILTCVPKALINSSNISYEDSKLGFKIGYIKDDSETGVSFVQSFDNIYKYFKERYPRTGKLLQYPYSFVEVTAYNGDMMLIKPQCLQDQELEFCVLNYLSNNPRMVVYPKYYNDNGDNGFDTGLDYLPSDWTAGDFLDNCITISNFPQFPIAINNYNLYMANNANNFAFQKDAIGINATESKVRGALGIASAIPSLLTGNIGGGVGAVMGGIDNLYQGKKNEYLSTQQILAQQNDAKLTPPSLGGQSGGDGFNVSKKITGITLKWKQIKPAYYNRIKNYFIRYGYKLNKFDYPDNYFSLNEELNFVKTNGCKISGNIPTQAILILQNIFDNGVTLWHKDDIGNYTDNWNI